jgi:hypothetical protein
MAAVGSYQTRAGRRWRVRYRTPDRRQTDKRGFATRREAQVYASTIEVRKAGGDFVSALAGRITIGELAHVWLHKKQHSTAPSHYRTLESAWRTHVSAVAEAEFIRNDGISVPYSVIYDVAENSLKGSNMSGPVELKLRQTQTFYEGGDSSSVSSPSGAPQLNGSHSRRCRHHRRTAAIW